MNHKPFQDRLSSDGIYMPNTASFQDPFSLFIAVESGPVVERKKTPPSIFLKEAKQVIYYDVKAKILGRKCLV